MKSSVLKQLRRCVCLAVVTAGCGFDGAVGDVLWADVCTQPDVKTAKWCDEAAPIQERAEVFVAALKPNEKVPLMTNEAQGVKRLYIPPYQWGSEGLHGPLEPCVCDSSKKCACPTSFPAPSAMGSAFNISLYWHIGHADGIEARAINNLRNHITQNNYGDGIDYWSPTVNMQRDPRWGRNQEVPGEDPMITGQYAANFIRGLQGETQDNTPVDPEGHTSIMACCKHFVGNSLESWNGNTRHNFDAQIPLRDMADYYLPAFKACVMDGHVKGIMCSYNAVNGVPMCANALYLNSTLRNSWRFDGYVTSDCDAVGDIFTPEPRGHGYADPTNGTALALLAGTDMDCGDWGAHAYLNNLPAAVSAGLIQQDDLDRSLIRLTKIQMELGLFDTSKQNQMYFQLGLDNISTPDHQQLALDAARQSIVLLKNDKNILPLKSGQNIAVIGPHSIGRMVFLSNYHGSRCLQNGTISKDSNYDACIQSPGEAISAANVNGETNVTQGCPVNGGSADGIVQAVAAAKEADVVICVMGIDGTIEAEGHDRENITLPGMQETLLTQVLALGKPVVLVLVNGGTISLGPFKDQIPVIVEAFYGGEMASQAMADVIFGKYNPSGRLAVTMYPASFTGEVPLTQMSVTEAPGRTHMYYQGVPEFEFGDGLSYTTFTATWLHSASSLTLGTSRDSQQKLHVQVENTGLVCGAVKVLALWRPVTEHLGPLRQKLFDFAGVHLGIGESSILEFNVKASHFAVADETGVRTVRPGEYEVFFKGLTQAPDAMRLSVVGLQREVDEDE